MRLFRKKSVARVKRESFTESGFREDVCPVNFIYT